MITARAVIISGFIAGFGFSPLTTHANVYKERERTAQEIKDHESRLGHIHEEVETLQGQLKSFDESIAAMNKNIAANDFKIASTEKEITIKSKELAETKRQHKDLLRQKYVLSAVSTIEMLASSRSLSDFFDAHQHVAEISLKTKSKAIEIGRINESLKSQRKHLGETQARLSADKEAVAAEKAKKTELLSATKGEEGRYQDILAQSKQRKSAIDAQIAEISRVAAAAAAAKEAARKAEAERAAVAAREAATRNAARPAATPAPAPPPAPTNSIGATGSVKRGQIIGYMASTGFSTGVHLHFTVFKSGSAIDPLPMIRNGQMAHPAPGSYLTQGFGPANWSNSVYDFHNGLDYANAYGTPIRAAADGDIITRSWDKYGYGNYVIINHNNGMTSLYGHMK